MNSKTNIYLMSLCFLLLFIGCKEEKQNITGEKYNTLTIVTSDQTLQTTYPAILRGHQTVEIRPQVSGIITEIRINEGDIVKRGQILFIIDQVPYKAALETALANVKSAEAKLQTARLTTKSKEELYKEKVISDFDLQTARNQQLEAEAALAQAQAEETNARNNLSYTEVKSPVDGVASMIPYRVGALVNSNITEPLVTVSDANKIHAYFSMAENQILDILQQYGSLEDACKKMPPVNLIMSNGHSFQTEGHIDAISGTIDKTTGAVTLRATFPNKQHLLRDGGSGTISLPTTYKNCISIPQSATYELQNRVFTWKIVNGKTKSTPITIHKYNDGKTYIVLSGLKEGDIIISEGAGLMHEDIPVNIKNTDTTENN